MKRQGLRLMIARAIRENLTTKFWSLVPVKRYITRELLASYCVCRSTKITDADYLGALRLLHKENETRIKDQAALSLRERRIKVHEYLDSM